MMTKRGEVFNGNSKSSDAGEVLIEEQLPPSINIKNSDLSESTANNWEIVGMHDTIRKGSGKITINRVYSTRVHTHTQGKERGVVIRMT